MMQAKPIVRDGRVTKPEQNARIQYHLEVDGRLVPIKIYFLQNGITLRPVEYGYAHPHPGFDRIFLFESGHGNVQTAEGMYHLEGRRIFLMPVNQSYEIIYSAKSNLYYFHVWVEGEMGLPIFLRMQGFPCIESGLFEQVIDAVDAGDPMRWHPLILQIVLEFTRPLIPDLIQKKDKLDRYHELVEIIQKNPSPKLTVAKLAKKMRISQSALSKGFQRATGIALKHYILQIQIQKAKEMLLNSDMMIQEIAYALGYGEPYYFFRVFKRITGETPSEYRRKAHDLAVEP